MAEETNVTDTDIFDEFFTDTPGTRKTYEKKETDETRTGQVLNAMSPYKLGTTMFRLIPDNVRVDVNGKKILRLFRKVNNGLSGRIVGKDGGMIYFQVPDKNDFINSGTQLTDEQVNLLTEVRTSINNLMAYSGSIWQNDKKYPTIVKLLPKCDYKKQLVFTYGKLLKFVPKAGSGCEPYPEKELNKVRVFKFDKGKVGENDFITILTNALSTKSSVLGTSTWKKDYFARTEGGSDKALVLTVGRSEAGFKPYTMSVAFETVSKYEITKEDLDIADNLNSRVYDVSKFDTEFYKKLKDALDYVQSEVNKLSTAPVK